MDLGYDSYLASKLAIASMALAWAYCDFCESENIVNGTNTFIKNICEEISWVQYKNSYYKRDKDWIEFDSYC